MSPRRLAPARSTERHGGSRRRKTRFLLVCEGEATESDYFHDLRRTLRSPLIEMEVSTPGGDPLALVRVAAERLAEANKRARRERDDNLRYDEVWCVLDVDEHRRLPQAVELADSRGIRLAVSNPCFELWVLLHFVDQHAYIERSDLFRKLCRHLPGYDKHLKYELLRDGYADARDRAAGLAARHEKDDNPGANPSTAVFLLVERLRASAAE